MKTKAKKTATLGIISCFTVVTFIFFLGVNAAPKIIVQQKRVLIFSKTNGYRHENIEIAIDAIKKLGQTNNFIADATEDSLDINDSTLSSYQAIIFLNTSGKVLGQPEEKALQNFIRKGNGFMGIHAAADCEYNWPWYVAMIGASFESHPPQQIAKILVVNNSHLSTKHLPLVWERKDEWYNFKNINPLINVLLKIDEKSYSGGKNGENHPLAWYHNFEGGRAFYTELGHTKESYTEKLFLKHLAGGIKYALGKKKYLKTKAVTIQNCIN